MDNKATFKIKSAFFLGAALWLVVCLASGATLRAASGKDVMSQAPGLINAYLYFAAPGGTHLKAVSKQFASGMDTHKLCRALLEALMAGPLTSDVKRIFPESTRVNALFITANNDAYVDLKIDGDTIGPTDTITEYLGVYSLVNSLTVNIPQIRRVKILMNGSEAVSLGGHISLDTFFETNMLIVK